MIAALALGGVLLIGLVWQDAFETIVLPRRVTNRFRLARVFYWQTWRYWRRIAHRVAEGGSRETFLSFYGPLSLLLLIALWAVGLIVGFALVQRGLGSDMVGPEGSATLWGTLYMSGTTFFTLGFGDITPRDGLGRFVAVLEAGTGFGFLALLISYLPVLYQAFSRREVSVSMLDARAGSPPSAGELLARLGHDDDHESLLPFLTDWERWSAEVLESHLSYPVLAYYRSQHEHQSWLAALTLVLDVSALKIAGAIGPTGSAGPAVRQARLTFAMARHAAVDLSQTFGAEPNTALAENRLPPDELLRFRAILQEAGIMLREDAAADAQLTALRELYEPYVSALSRLLLLELPAWCPPAHTADDWQTSAWERSVGAARH